MIKEVQVSDMFMASGIEVINKVEIINEEDFKEWVKDMAGYGGGPFTSTYIQEDGSEARVTFNVIRL